MRIHIRCYKLGDSCQVLQVMYALPRHAMKLKAFGLKFLVPSFKATQVNFLFADSFAGQYFLELPDLHDHM